MDCFEETEFVIDYLEKNITCIDYTEISRLIGVPFGLYQRIFGYICDVSIGEYVRKRKLTLAASELLSMSKSVIDVALNYGYDSHSAFTRAIKEQFGVPPTALTNEILIKNLYPRFSFQKDETYLVMKGPKIMAELVKIEYEETEETLFIGIKNSDFGVSGRGLWDVFFEQGYDKKLYKLNENQLECMDDCIGVGYLTDFAPGNEQELGNKYIIGKYFKLNTPIPEGMTNKIIPKGITAKAQVRGKNFDEILNNAYILIKDMVTKNGYCLDYTDFYWSEVYTCSRFCEPLENGANKIILDWYMPCRKINS